MGLQDRDYYWEKHKEASRNSNSDSFHRLLNQKPYRAQSKSGSSGIKFLLYPLIAIVALWYGADTFLKYQESQKNRILPPIPSAPSPASRIPVSPTKPHAIEPISGGIILKADRQGHFRGTVMINNVAMPFLIDTGATTTTIPEKFAYSARLPFGRPVQSNTAGGKVVGRLTKIDSLRIGNAEIRSLDANINSYLDEVLIGMNTLKYFHMTQNGNTMRLVANGSSMQQVARTLASQTESFPAAEQPAVKQPTTIKKTVTCDARQVCTTKYSDR